MNFLQATILFSVRQKGPAKGHRAFRGSYIVMRKLTAAAAVSVSVFALLTGAASAEKLTIGLASEPTAMDPHFHNLGPNNAISYHLFDRLIAQDEKQRLSPGLAVSWQPIDDLTWEVQTARRREIP
jgi:ABC-type transport system substrate-binding protein